jgi:hypothetical protein
MFERAFYDTVAAARRDAPAGTTLFRVQLAPADGGRRELLVNLAIAPLERAVALRAASGVLAGKQAEAELLLARALHGSGRDRARALVLARAARDKLTTDKERAEADAWLREHGSP